MISLVRIPIFLIAFSQRFLSTKILVLNVVGMISSLSYSGKFHWINNEVANIFISLTCTWNAIRFSEYFIVRFSHSLFIAYSEIFWISVIVTFGTINAKSTSFILDCALNSDNLNESVPTKIKLSAFALSNTHVNTGLKFFSVTAYSTLDTPSLNNCVSTESVFSFGTSGNATYSLAAIPLISNVSFADFIVIICDF